MPQNPGQRKNTVSGEGFRWPPVPPMRKAMCSTQRTDETEAQIIDESAERTSGAEVGAAEGEAPPKVYSQNPQQQWVLGEEEEANGYADEQRLENSAK